MKRQSVKHKKGINAGLDIFMAIPKGLVPATTVMRDKKNKRVQKFDYRSEMRNY